MIYQTLQSGKTPALAGASHTTLTVAVLLYHEVNMYEWVDHHDGFSIRHVVVFAEPGVSKLLACSQVVRACFEVERLGGSCEDLLSWLLQGQGETVPSAAADGKLTGRGD
jgi:hypothetical protein